LGLAACIFLKQSLLLLISDYIRISVLIEEYMMMWHLISHHKQLNERLMSVFIYQDTAPELS
jgi:hypothetical protein